MSEYVGTIGGKVDAEVKLVNIFEYTDYKFSYYGTTHYIYTMVDGKGNVYVWKSTAIMAVVMKDDSLKDRCFIRKGDSYFIRKGDVIHLRASVKEHSEYKGTKQTVLTRCKVVDLVEVVLTEQERTEAKAAEQRASLKDGDTIWEMPYRQYKAHYSDCETIAGSYDPHENAKGECTDYPTIKVIIRAGRLKASGVRGEHYHGWEFTAVDENGKKMVVCKRAVSCENALKQIMKDPELRKYEWEYTHCYDYHVDRIW